MTLLVYLGSLRLLKHVAAVGRRDSSTMRIREKRRTN